MGARAARGRNPLAPGEGEQVSQFQQRKGMDAAWSSRGVTMLEVLVRIDNVFVTGHFMTFRAPVQDAGQAVVPVDPVLKSEQHRFVHHEIFFVGKKNPGTFPGVYVPTDSCILVDICYYDSWIYKGFCYNSKDRVCTQILPPMTPIPKRALDVARFTQERDCTTFLEYKTICCNKYEGN
jgi:hypothetical protein